MTVTNTELTPMLQPEGYVVLAVAVNGDVSLVGTVVFKTQQAANTALLAAANAPVGATTKYYVVHLNVLSGILATVT